MQYTINQLNQQIFPNVYKVYEIFQNHFGEENTDLQNLPSDKEIALSLYMTPEEVNGHDFSEEEINILKGIYRSTKPFILVYWPRVKVTNEHDRFVIIQDLYAKIDIDADGLIPVEKRGFLLNRATYTQEQWDSDYLHSHICRIPKEDPTKFQEPCLGTGPIRATIDSLRDGIAEEFDEIKWMLFCEELSRYVTVESLTGRPYRYLENIGSFRESDIYNNFSFRGYATQIETFEDVLGENTLKDFIHYYLHNGHLKISYRNERFTTGLPHFEYIIDISNAFIDFLNNRMIGSACVDECFQNGILKRVMAINRKLLTERNNVPSNIEDFIGRAVCTFKGRTVTLNILRSQDTETKPSIVINHYIAMYVLYNILRIINYHYNEHTNNAGAESPAKTHQKVYYF